MLITSTFSNAPRHENSPELFLPKWLSEHITPAWFSHGFPWKVPHCSRPAVVHFSFFSFSCSVAPGLCWIAVLRVGERVVLTLFNMQCQPFLLFRLISLSHSPSFYYRRVQMYVMDTRVCFSVTIVFLAFTLKCCLRVPCTWGGWRILAVALVATKEDIYHVLYFFFFFCDV